MAQTTGPLCDYCAGNLGPGPEVLMCEQHAAAFQRLRDVQRPRLRDYAKSVGVPESPAWLDGFFAHLERQMEPR